jgi:7-dehydrocholesterol reductase
MAFSNLKALITKDFPFNIYVTPNAAALKIIGSFALLQLVLLVVIPGRSWQACITPAGLRPTYKLNGPACYFITLALWYLGGNSHILRI